MTAKKLTLAQRIDDLEAANALLVARVADLERLNALVVYGREMERHSKDVATYVSDELRRHYADTLLRSRGEYQTWVDAANAVVRANGGPVFPGEKAVENATRPEKR